MAIRLQGHAGLSTDRGSGGGRPCACIARLSRFLAPLVFLVASSAAPGAIPSHEKAALAPGAAWSRSLGRLARGIRLELVVSLAKPREHDRVVVELEGPVGSFRKTLHAGDPDLFLPVRFERDGELVLKLRREDQGDAPLSFFASWVETGSDDALEAEPNDDWRTANPLVLGRPVYGSADDVDWLENVEEGRLGMDWFQFEVDSEAPVLATFTLDLIDRDVSADLAAFTIENGTPVPYLVGKDPMETIHDRERVRYSKNLVRTLSKGTYYLRVNANHPAYILRSRTSPPPPFDEDPTRAVEVGLHYLLNAGDAWLGQVPREGDRFVRSANLHETSLRCTGCHAAGFPAEAALAARRAGYTIEARDALAHMIERIADGPAPLYGDAGLFWQRYIATPLEALGAQGSLLVDFDREIADVPDAALERFGPFLKAAWSGRNSLPEDEHNVVPAESKFGLAWKGWRVLDESARRAGREEDARAAANIARVATSRIADRQVETLQDRIHRLIAWSLMSPSAHAQKIQREIGSLSALQNPDGGWHESDARPGPSAVYVTAQILDAFQEAGLTRDHPVVARGLKYLIDTQQPFGGWFQPDTHENFQTPMRETRWAVAALAHAYPRVDSLRRGWGGGPATPPRSDSIVHALEDLESAWNPPADDASAFHWTVTDLLNHESPLVRASAAACLGRLGGRGSEPPLIAALNDPSKLVRRAAGFSLRAIGNRGADAGAVVDALTHARPRARREAVSLLTRQVPGFSASPLLIDRLIRRVGDPDLLTRIEAARALRRWFYRTEDLGNRRRIMDALIARLAVEIEPLPRRNLCENLYILMDENLGGGVSLQRNLTALPEPLREPVLEARREVERHAILDPIFAALVGGGERQREGLLASFDGSFFRGRTYARRPVGAVDVGNDREFGFLYEPPLEETEQVFAPLLADLKGVNRRRALQLASFFQVPGRSRSIRIQTAVLESLDDSDVETRAEALRIIGREMSFDGAENHPELVEAIASRLSGPAEVRATMIAAVGRNPALAGRAEVVAAVSNLTSRSDASPDLLPILDRLGLSDADVVATVDQGWERYEPNRKAQGLDVLLRLPASAEVDALLARAAADPSESIRERAVAARIERAPSTADASAAILPALDDDAPRIRLLALEAAARRASFWDRADALEALARKLVDPDTAIRSGSLDVVKHHRLLSRFPILARRIRVLTDDPSLGPRAQALLKADGRDPAALLPDAALDRPLILDLPSFERDVNPLLYRPGADGHACVDCHATHTILRLAPRRDGGPSTEDVASNLASASRVVDLGRPEESPLLLKPRSPHGQGEPDPESPTGTTHAGGPRWEDADHPAFRALLSWIRSSAAQPAPAPLLPPDHVPVQHGLLDPIANP